MKRFLMAFCLTVLLVMALAVPAMAAEGEHTHCICNGKLAGHAHSQIPYDTVVTTEAELKAAVTTGTEGTVNILLGADITLDEEIGITGKTVNLCLGSHKLTMSGSKARLTANAANSDVNYRGTLNITACGGGSIVAASGCRVGSLYTFKGYLNVYGGKVDATNTASGTGGAVIVGYAGDGFTLYNGEIIGSLKGTSGGAIYCKVAGTVRIAGGTVRDGHATSKGGNICMDHDSAVLKVSGGTISGGQAATLGGNIDVIRGSLEITGGTITGGSAGGDTGYPGHGGAGICMEWNAQSFTLSGNAKIYGNTGVVGDENAVGEDVRLNGNLNGVKNQITLGQWEGNGTNPALRLFKGVASPEGVKVVTFAEGVQNPITMKSYFTVVNEGYQLAMLETSGYTLEADTKHIHCVCGGQAAGMGHTCLDIVFEAGTAASDLSAGGNVYLSDDLVMDSEVAVGGKTLNLCLNDKTITMSNKGRLTANSEGGDMTKKGTVSITACDGGSIVAAEDNRAGLMFTYKGTLNLYGGTIDASACVAGAYGGAVTVGYPEDVFNMYGGTLVANADAEQGGAIAANNEKSKYTGDYADTTIDRFVNIYGGTLSGTNPNKIYMINGLLTVNGTSTIGGEPAIQNTAKAVYNGVSLNGSYSTVYTMAHALAVAGETDRIVLLDDLADQTVSKSVHLDLNGKALTGLTVTNGAVISLLDSDASDYTAGNGYLALAEGTSAAFDQDFLTGSLNGYGHNYRFITIADPEGNYTAHRVYLAIKSTSLYPSKTGIKYNAVLRCDAVIAGLLNGTTGDYGIELTYTDFDVENKVALDSTVSKSASFLSDEFVVKAFDADTLEDNDAKAGLLNLLANTQSDELKNHVAHMKLVGTAYIKIGDLVVNSAEVSYSLQDLAEKADTIYADLTETQQGLMQTIYADLTETQQGLMETMYNTWKAYLTEWNWSLPNVVAALTPESETEG